MDTPSTLTAAIALIRKENSGLSNLEARRLAVQRWTIFRNPARKEVARGPNVPTVRAPAVVAKAAPAQPSEFDQLRSALDAAGREIADRRTQIEELTSENEDLREDAKADGEEIVGLKAQIVALKTELAKKVPAPAKGAGGKGATATAAGDSSQPGGEHDPLATPGASAGLLP